jgi:hypothetical protein
MACHQDRHLSCSKAKVSDFESSARKTFGILNTTQRPLYDSPTMRRQTCLSTFMDSTIGRLLMGGLLTTRLPANTRTITIPTGRTHGRYGTT